MSNQPWADVISVERDPKSKRKERRAQTLDDAPGFALFMLIVLPFLSFWQAWILSRLWDWFFVAYFGLIAVPWAVWVGVAAFKAVLLPSNKKYETVGDYQSMLWSSSVGYAIVLFIAWIAARIAAG